jgi:hypothetical protein
MTSHRITFDRDARRYHTWSCSCGEHGDPALLRHTAKSEAMAHIRATEDDEVEPSTSIAHGHEGNCEACTLRVDVGERIHVYEDAIVHESCPGSRERAQA